MQILCEAQTVEQLRRACGRTVRVDARQFGVAVCDLRAVVDLLGVCQLGVQFHQFAIAREYIVQCGFVGFGHFLRDMRQYPMRGDDDVACIGVQLATQ